MGHPTGAAWPISIERADYEGGTMWTATYWDGTVVRSESLTDIDPFLTAEILPFYST